MSFHTIARPAPTERSTDCGASVFGGAAKVRTLDKVHAETRKLTQSKPNANASPRASATMPSPPLLPLRASRPAAISGPTSMVSWRSPIIMPLAAWKCSGAIACGIIDVPDGMPKACARPMAKASA